MFFVGFLLTVVFASVHGVAYLVEGFSFVDWLYPTVLLGRMAAFLGLAGLSVEVVSRYPRVGKLSRVVVSLALLFATGLVALSILQTVGVTTPVIAVFGLGTVLLTILAFALFGLVGLSTDSYSSVVGGLLLVATLAVVFVLVGQGAFSTDFRGAIGEGLIAFAFLANWYVLRNEGRATETVETAPGTPAE